MKKRLSFILVILLTLFSLMTCKSKIVSTGKPLIITTIFPYKLIVSQLAGDMFHIEVLLPANASPHTWSPTPADIAKLNQAEIIISNGLGLETNLITYLDELKDKHIEVSSFVEDSLLVLDDINTIQSHHKDIHEGANPHIWTSPKLLLPIVNGIANELEKRYPILGGRITKNKTMLIKELMQTDEKIKKERATFTNAAIVTQHDAFSYFFQYYGITFVGSIHGSGAKEPSPKDLAYLAEQIKKYNIKSIFIEPRINPKPAEVLAKELNLTIRRYDDLGTTLGVSSFSDYLYKNWYLIKAGL